MARSQWPSLASQAPAFTSVAARQMPQPIKRPLSACEGENAIRAQPISSRRRAAASPKPARRPETADGGAASRRAASPAPLGRQLLHERRAYGSMYMSLRDGKHFRA